RRRQERKDAQQKQEALTKPDEKVSVSTEEKENAIEGQSLFQIKWVRFLLVIGSAFVLALIAYTTILYGGRLIVDDEKLIISPPTTIETTEGEIIWYLYDEFRLPVTLDDIPEHVQDAFVAIEDRRFYSHTGVDFRSISRAL